MDESKTSYGDTRKNGLLTWPVARVLHAWVTLTLHSACVGNVFRSAAYQSLLARLVLMAWHAGQATIHVPRNTHFHHKSKYVEPVMKKKHCELGYTAASLSVELRGVAQMHVIAKLQSRKRCIKRWPVIQLSTTEHKNPTPKSLPPEESELAVAGGIALGSCLHSS